MKSHSTSDFSTRVFADKTKLTDGEPADGDDGGIQEVSGAAAGPMSVVRPLQSEDPGNEVLPVMAGCLNTNHPVEVMWMVRRLHQLCRMFSLSQMFDLLEMSREQFLGR